MKMYIYIYIYIYIFIRKNEKKKIGAESWKLATAQVYFREWEIVLQYRNCIAVRNL